MKNTTPWLTLCFVAFLLIGHATVCRAQAPANSQNKPATLVYAPPPLPPRAPPVDLATRLLDPQKLKSVKAAHEAWKQSGGGAEFHSGLTFVGGRPVLMLIADRNESAAIQARRKNSIVGACEFLLATEAFDTATICIVETDKQNPRVKPSSHRNTRVARNVFEGAAKSAGKSTDLKTAISAAKKDDAAVLVICTAIGIR